MAELEPDAALTRFFFFHLSLHSSSLVSATLAFPSSLLPNQLVSLLSFFPFSFTRHWLLRGGTASGESLRS